VAAGDAVCVDDAEGGAGSGGPLETENLLTAMYAAAASTAAVAHARPWTPTGTRPTS
jgi:hypothetical protein